MNELDREMILAQRGEERDAAVERRRNAKMAKQAQRAATAVRLFPSLHNIQLSARAVSALAGFASPAFAGSAV